MENKNQTAIQKMNDILESMIAKSLLDPQDKETTVGYQAAVVEMRKFVGGLLLMEETQINKAIEAAQRTDFWVKYEQVEQYYQETYGK